MIMWTWLPFLSYSKITITFLLSLISQTMNSTIQQAHTPHNCEEDTEFSFWGSSNTTSEEDCDQLEDNEATLNNKAVFRETCKRKNLKFGHSPFLPSNNHCPRSKAITEGKMELLEKIQDMSESSYELSFQHMVVEQPEQDQSETSIDNAQNSGSKVQPKNLKKKKCKSERPGKILRAESMDSETFLLKMFFPTSLDWMKKPKAKNGSKVSSRPSLQESIKQLGKEWRIKRFFLAEDNKGDTEDCMSRNTDGGSSNGKNRYVDRSFSLSHDCWPFLHYTKSKSKKVEE